MPLRRASSYPPCRRITVGVAATSTRTLMPYRKRRPPRRRLPILPLRITATRRRQNSIPIEGSPPLQTIPSQPPIPICTMCHRRGHLSIQERRRRRRTQRSSGMKQNRQFTPVYPVSHLRHRKECFILLPLLFLVVLLRLSNLQSSVTDFTIGIHWNHVANNAQGILFALYRYV